MLEPKEKTQYKPRLTVELDLGLRKAFKLACYAEDTTMHDKIIELIKEHIGKVSE